MEIVLNGEAKQIAAGCTADQLIFTLGIADQRIALEVNGEIVPRSAYPSHRLYPGDRVEIVRAIGGG